MDIIRWVGYPINASRNASVAIEEQHVALPKLYGAPAYARPLRIVADTPRPLDADDLPIDAVQTPEERDLAATLPARFYAAGGLHAGQLEDASGSREPTLMPRPTSLRALAGRILGQTGN
jgi:hypothetical protein